MKNIFILIFIAAFTSATAQENGMFDIKKHIEKRRIEWKKQFEQKKSAFPQQTNCWGGGRFATPIPTISSLLNIDKVIINPKYKMPVIITGMRRFQLMPNAGEDYFTKNFYVPGKPKLNDIPNGALPLPNTLLELFKNKNK